MCSSQFGAHATCCPKTDIPEHPEPGEIGVAPQEINL